MNSRQIWIIALFCLVFFSFTAFGQEAGVTGFPAFAPIAGGPDNLNLATLNAHFQFPIANKAGRGLPFQFALNYDTTPLWIFNPTVTTNQTWGWANAHVAYASYTVQPFGYITYVVYSTGCSGDSKATNYGSWTYVDGSGTVHQFPSSFFVSTDAVCYPTQATQSVTDNSGFILTASSNGPAATVKDGSGNTYSVPLLNVTGVAGVYGNVTGPASMVDRNGNTISTDGQSSFTDTVGTTGVVSYSSVYGLWNGSFQYITSTTYTYKAVGGGTATVTVNYKLYRGIATAFGCSSGDVSVGNNNPGIPMVDSIVYADGSKYSFTYEQTNPQQLPGYITGRLASLTLPTGGIIAYNYEGDTSGTINCSDGTPLNLTRTTPDGTWTYARTITGSSSTTTVTDPLGNQTVYTFQNGYPVETQVYQGTVSSGTLLRTTLTCYNGNTSSSTCSTVSVAAPVTQETVFLLLPNGEQSERNYVIDQASGATTEEDDYDFGSNAPGALLKKTLTQLASLGNNILGMPQSVTIRDGSSNQVAQTTYGYDETALAATSGLPQHNSVSGSRGNLTSVHQWLNTTSGMLTSTLAYDDAGQVLSTTDANSNTTSFNYTCSDAYPSKVTLPNTGVAHITSAGYDCSTGLKASDTDQNNQLTSYSYDNLLRLTQTTYPDGGQTTTSYPSATQQVVQSKINGSASTYSSTLLDGLGRVSRTITANGESAPYDQQDTCYNADGQIGFQSYAYQGSGFSASKVCSGAGDSYIYDALGRQTQVMHSDGTSAQYTQETRTVQASEEGNGSFTPARIMEMDALGRTVATCEVSNTSFFGSSGTPASCGLDITGSGFLTKYTYDALGNVTSVAQGALNPRTYTYDSLSRLVSSSDPESGMVCYGTLNSSGNCLKNGYDGNGNVIYKTAPAPNQTGNATVTTTLAYDALNRLTQRSYNDGITPTAHFQYDTAAGWSNATQQNLVGRMSYAWTANPSGAMFAGQIFGYDAMGRVIVNNQCTPYTCGSSNYAINYTYDLGGDMLTLNGGGVTLNYNYNVAQRLTGITSSLNDSNHPGALLSNAHYSPTQVTDSLGNGLSDTTTLSTRGLLTSYTVQNTGLVASPNDSTGNVTINGSLQQIQAQYASGWVTIGGGPDQCRTFQVGANGTSVICDQGTISVTVNGTCTGSVTYTGTPTFSPTTSTLASSLASSLNSNCSASINAAVSQSNSSEVIITANTIGSGGNSISLSTSVTWMTQGPMGQPGFSSASYGSSISGSSLSGGQDGAIDSGTCTITVNGHNDSDSWSGSGTSAAGIASSLEQAINGDNAAYVTASLLNPTTVALASKRTGVSYPFSSSCTYNSSLFSSPSFTTADSGANSGTALSLPVYSYSLTNAPDGNVTGANDQLNGNWTLGYDSLNHLSSANKNSGQQTFSYGYDAYGNRWQQNAPQGGPAPQYNFDNNDHISGSGISYDAAGNITADGLGDTFTWDAEGRLIKASNANGTYTYVYDALGHRVQGPNGYYLYDLNNRPIMLISNSGSLTSGEFYAGNRHLGTYSGGTTSFIHTDWLATKRVVTGVNASVLQTCTGLPFGDGVSCSGTSTTFTGFTDDVHDAETNLEHTLFRKYSSTQGRWLSPDPAGMAVGDPSNPQSWNRYAYVTNNPSNFGDPLGLESPLPDPPQPPPDPPYEPNSSFFNPINKPCIQFGIAQSACTTFDLWQEMGGLGGGPLSFGGPAFAFQGGPPKPANPQDQSCYLTAQNTYIDDVQQAIRDGRVAGYIGGGTGFVGALGIGGGTIIANILKGGVSLEAGVASGGLTILFALTVSVTANAVTEHYTIEAKLDAAVSKFHGTLSQVCKAGGYWVPPGLIL